MNNENNDLIISLAKGLINKDEMHLEGGVKITPRIAHDKLYWLEQHDLDIAMQAFNFFTLREDGLISQIGATIADIDAEYESACADIITCSELSKNENSAPTFILNITRFELIHSIKTKLCFIALVRENIDFLSEQLAQEDGK